MNPKILLIYTGGTIGMTKLANKEILQPFNFDSLLKKIPELKLLQCEIETISFEPPIDSSNIGPNHWIHLAELIESHYETHQGFVVLHGSDTMSYSASALSFMLENLNKPVIFTGSQLPIGDLRTDAKENLITAIHLASLQQNNIPIIKEVGLYFEYKLFRGNRTTKINADHFNAFASNNYAPLVTSGVELQVQYNLLLKKHPNKEIKVWKNLNTNIVLIKLFPGIQSTTIASILEAPNLKGVVLETYGSGNATTSNWFLKLIKQAISKGIYIVNTSQCSGGMVQMGKYETSQYLQELGVISCKDMTTEAAITKMMFLLGSNQHKNFRFAYQTSLRGELTEN